MTLYVPAMSKAEVQSCLPPWSVHREDNPILTQLKVKGRCMSRLVRWNQVCEVCTHVCLSEKNKFRHGSANSLGQWNVPCLICSGISFLQDKNQGSGCELRGFLPHGVQALMMTVPTTTLQQVDVLVSPQILLRRGALPVTLQLFQRITGAEPGVFSASRWLIRLPDKHLAPTLVIIQVGPVTGSCCAPFYQRLPDASIIPEALWIF